MSDEQLEQVLPYIGGAIMAVVATAPWWATTILKCLEVFP